MQYYNNNNKIVYVNVFKVAFFGFVLDVWRHREQRKAFKYVLMIENEAFDLIES